MISITLNQAKLSQNLSKIAKPQEVQAIRKKLSNAKEWDALKKELTAKHTQWIAKLTTQNKAGWANDPILKKRVLVEKGTGIRYLAVDGQIISLEGNVTFPTIKFDFDTFMKDTAHHENDIEVMYLDTKGYVTVGRGHRVKGETGAVSIHNSLLPFYRKKDGKRATDDEVMAEYNHVKQLVKGNGKKYYRDNTTLEANESDITNLAVKDGQVLLSEIETVLKLDEFSTYPLSVQLAIADMQYNMGSTNFNAGFPKFLNAIKHRDWETAASESSRKDVGADRNTDTKNKLTEALGNPIYFITTDEERRMEKHQFLLNGYLMCTKTSDDKAP
ncbi:hypothetical protein KAR91_19080 [Candidatus Pacearchaeota archaeon]|nr:hypothetical protein [Candidatus Pacearchaeota archaeon]